MFVNGRELITTYWAVSFFPGLITHLVVLVINQTIPGSEIGRFQFSGLVEVVI